MTTRPLVSVILPAFNRLTFLREAVESVFAQTLRDWELIIADDGSDEDTIAYLRTLASHDRVRVLWLPHSGVPARVRNAALRVATGQYVAFIDSDDLWEPDKLEVQVTTLSPHSWGYTACRRIDQAGHVLVGDASLHHWVPYSGDVFEELVTSAASVSTPGVIALRQLVRDVGGFDDSIRMAEDYDLWMRLALRATAAVVETPLVRVRKHDQNSPSEWSGLYEGRDISLRKLESLAPAHRHMIRRERTLNAVRHASHQAPRLGCGKAFRTLARSARYSWSSVAWWRGCLRVCQQCTIGRVWRR